MAPPSRPTAVLPAVGLLVAVVAVDVALQGVLGRESLISSWWTSVGLAVGLVAVVPVRRWPVVVALLLLEGVAVRIAVGVDVVGAAGISLAHAVTAVLGALVLTRGGRSRARLDTLGDLGLVTAAALLSGGIALAEPFVYGTRTTPTQLLEGCAQHAVSVLLLTPLALVGHRVRARADVDLELVAQLVVLAALTAAIFAPGQDLPLAFACVPALVWAALRFDVGIVAAELAAFALAVTLATAYGSGPIDEAGQRREITGLIVLLYVLCVVPLTLPLALTMGQRLRLMDRLSADELIFRRNFTESPLGMLLLHEHDGELVIDELNAAAATVMGASHDAIAGRRLGEVIATVDRTDHLLTSFVQGRTDSWHGQAVVLGRPGSRVEVAIAVLDWRDGSRVYSAQMLDGTREHDAHRRLEAAYRLNDATLDTTACIILVADADGTVVRVNAATHEITGYGEADLVGRRLWDIPISALSRTEAEAMFVWPNRSGYPMVSEQLTRTAHGMPLRIVWNNNLVLDDHGQPSYAVLTGIDVTAERTSTGLMSHLLSASIATALVGVDSLGRITLFNAGAAHMLGWPTETMLGRPFVGLFDADHLASRTGSTGDHEAFLCLVGLIGDRDETPARDWIWRTRHGHELVVSMTLSVTEDLGDGQLSILCVGRDVTAQREAQETLVAALEKERTAVERLRFLDRAKDEFVSTVSHELRTPVTSIMGYTEMLRDGSVVGPSPDQVPMLERIARNSQRLIAICNDLLLLSGFEADATLGTRTRVDLRTCVTEAAESLSVAPSEHGVELDIAPGTTPLEVTGDPGQLDRLVANLLGNAVKFTPAGGRVRASLDRDDTHAVLTVDDTGIGIPTGDHEAIFQRFYRSEEAQVQAIPGTGLGLSIVAAIAKAHEGRIEVESEPGRGTTFRVSIPLTDQPQPLAAGANPPG